MRSRYLSMSGIARTSSRRSKSGFVLLEVIVAMVILGVSIATMMRSFTLSLAAIRRNDAATQSTVLAESVLQSLEADPPEPKKRLTGTFEEMGYPRYGYEVETSSEKIKYRLSSKNARPEDLRELKVVNLTITYDDPKGNQTRPADAYLILPPLERFSFDSKFFNELFTEEEGI